jgi:hypothetical protein
VLLCSATSSSLGSIGQADNDIVLLLDDREKSAASCVVDAEEAAVSLSCNNCAGQLSYPVLPSQQSPPQRSLTRKMLNATIVMEERHDEATRNAMEFKKIG